MDVLRTLPSWSHLIYIFSILYMFNKYIGLTLIVIKAFNSKNKNIPRGHVWVALICQKLGLESSSLLGPKANSVAGPHLSCVVHSSGPLIWDRGTFWTHSASTSTPPIVTPLGQVLQSVRSYSELILLWLSVLIVSVWSSFSQSSITQILIPRPHYRTALFASL